MISDVFEKIRQMSDRELYSFFREDQFYDDPETTRSVCQELENREAARMGRKPVIIDFDELPSGIAGIACNSEKPKRIVLNSAYLRKSFPQILTPGDAMNTIFHEGRHIWQHYVLETDDQRVPLSVRLLLRADTICYTNGRAGVIDIGIPQEEQAILEYALQENEMDARFYALKRMVEVQTLVGMDEAFLVDIERAKITELSHIRKAMAFFDEDKYQLLEKKRLEVYKARAKERYLLTGERLPELPKNFRCYQNIWMIHYVISPVYEFFLDNVEDLRKDIMNMGNILLGLYTIARERAAEGRPLETPAELVDIVIHSELCKDFSLKQEAIPKEWAKPIGM